MEKKKRKTFKEWIGSIKRRILLYKRSISFYLKISIVVFVETAAILVLYLLDVFRITKEMLYWLFAATSQSMAALFAVVGMFAVFRYQNLDDKLRNLYDSLKKKFSSGGWMVFFGDTESECWEDPVIADAAENLLKEKKGELPKTIKTNLDVSILFIRYLEEARNEVLVGAKIPLAAVLITFVFSIILIAFAGSISKNVFGIIILLVMLALITFSMVNLFYYLIYSIAPRKEKRVKKSNSEASGSQRP